NRCPNTARRISARTTRSRCITVALVGYSITHVAPSRDAARAARTNARRPGADVSMTSTAPQPSRRETSAASELPTPHRSLPKSPMASTPRTAGDCIRPPYSVGVDEPYARRAVLFDAYPHVYGGAQRIDHIITALLPARGWRVEVFTTDEGPLVERLRADGLPVTVVQPPLALRRYGRTTVGRKRLWALARLPAWTIRLARHLRAVRPEVVHLVDHHGIDRTKILNRIRARLAHEVVVPTRAVLRQMPELTRACALRAIPSVVPDHIRRAEPVTLATEPVIVSTARLHPDKGL